MQLARLCPAPTSLKFLKPSQCVDSDSFKLAANKLSSLKRCIRLSLGAMGTSPLNSGDGGVVLMNLGAGVDRIPGDRDRPGLSSPLATPASR